mgnify:FL=1
MTRTIYDVLEELEVDFKDLKYFINTAKDIDDKDLKRTLKSLINEFMIPQLKELTELLD